MLKGAKNSCQKAASALARETIARVNTTARQPLLWDIFCQVIDNHGDVGVCWRLARELAARGHAVRLWLDDLRALPWLAPGAWSGAFERIRVRPWPRSAQALAQLPLADVWVEAFGCELPAAFVARFAAEQAMPPPVWINLEYLSAEDWVERMHALPSPVLAGPLAGRRKWFFYPGFTPAAGGLLREGDWPARQARFDRAAWLAAHGVRWQGEPLASLFCYEPPALPALLEQCAASGWHWLVTPGRATQAVQAALPLLRSASAHITPRITFLPHLPQPAYDELLWACDFNGVRGEDSLTRALWAGRPFVWHIYPQHDGAHHAKLAAFLRWLQAPASLAAFHAAWNGAPGAPTLLAPGQAALREWQAYVQAARQRLMRQADLASQLIHFIHQKQSETST